VAQSLAVTAGYLSIVLGAVRAAAAFDRQPSRQPLIPH